MVLESTIVCIDNSEYSRNGDFAPTRYAAQVDAINRLCLAKVHANAESSVGVLTLAGRSARILLTSTREPDHIFACLHDVQHDGHADFVAGIQKAQLALRHRKNTLQRQRIVVFVASPVDAPVDALVRLGKSLKKNSVAVDVVNVGLEGDNVAKVDAFIAAVNSGENSHAMHVEAGGLNLADRIMNSDTFVDRDGDSAAGAGIAMTDPNDAADFATMDPSRIDPELAMVLRMSMEEEQARQAAARAAEAGDDAAAVPVGDATPAPQQIQSARYDEGDDDDALYGAPEDMEVDADDEDDEELRRAIELSRAEADASAGASGGAAKEEEKGNDGKAE